MNEDFINSFLQETNLQTDKIPQNDLFSVVPEPDPQQIAKTDQPNRAGLQGAEQQPVSIPEQDQTEENDTLPPAGTDAQPTFSFFHTAVEQAQQDSEKRLIESLTAQNPFFQYSKAMKEITDPETTFEDLRLQNVGDYPELDSKDRDVKWSVVYGSVTKSITDSNAKVFEVKAQIEKSKDFLDGLKNAKKEADKKPKCYVKATVVFQKKGKANIIPMYPTLEDAIASEKEVTYVPLKDGVIYQVRNNDIGIFIVPADPVPGQSPQANRYFHFCLPKLPASLLLQVVSFFQYICQKNGTEVLVNLLYDKTEQKYICDVPEQTVSGCEVTTNAEYDDSRYLHVMDIHSHNTMPAFFSSIDDVDELVSRLYMVIGRLDEAVPQIKLRASCGGKFIPLEVEKIFDIPKDSCPFPKKWIEKLKIKKQPKLINRLKGAWRRYADI